MELQELIMVVIATLAAIGGLVLVWLQKKGIIKPVLKQNANRFDYVSGGSILLFSTIIGAYILFKHIKILAVLYVVLFLGVYILIQIVWKNKE